MWSYFISLLDWMIMTLVVLAYSSLELITAQDNGTLRKDASIGTLKNETGKSNTSFGGRYLIKQNVHYINTSYNEVLQKGGRRIKEKTKTIIEKEIIIIIPDDENFVASKIVYEVYKAYLIITGQRSRRFNNKELITKVINLIRQKLENNLNLTKSFIDILKEHVQWAKKLIEKQELSDKLLKYYFHRLLQKISSGPHIEAQTKTLTVMQVQETIEKFVQINENIADRRGYEKKMAYIINSLLQNENNVTLVNSIGSEINKALDMFNIKHVKNARRLINNMIMRALSFLKYRIKFPMDFTYAPQIQSTTDNAKIRIKTYRDKKHDGYAEGEMKNVEDKSIIMEEDDILEISNERSQTQSTRSPRQVTLEQREEPGCDRCKRCRECRNCRKNNHHHTTTTTTKKNIICDDCNY